MTLKQQFRQIKKFPDWVYWLPARFLSLLRHTMRTEIVDPFGVIDAKSPPAITVTWHNRLLFPRDVRQMGTGAYRSRHQRFA